MSKTIIITGGGGGIGRATSRAFLDAGWKVGLVGRRVEALEATADGNPNALILACDVTKEDQVDGLSPRPMRHGAISMRCSTTLASR